MKQKVSISQISIALWISFTHSVHNTPAKVSFLALGLADPISLWRCRWLHSHFFILLFALTCHLPSSQMESMMLKLQRLQQKAVLDDDYDAGERRPRADGSLHHY